MEFIATSGNLHLEEVVAELIAAGLITQHGGQCVRDAALRSVEECHPLEFIASLELPGRVGEGRLTLDVLTDWLADWCGLERVHIDPLRVDVSRITAIMSLSYARRYDILCLNASADEIVVATMQPFDISWLESLQEFAERSVRRGVASPEQIKKYSERFYSLKASVVGAGAAIALMTDDAVPAHVLQIGDGDGVTADDQHVIKLVEWLLHFAFEQRASDIHLEPRLPEGRIRFRVDGILHLVYRLPDAVMTSMVSRLKILARMDVTERRRPQVGRIKTLSANSAAVELRLSSMPTALGEKLVVRIFDASLMMQSFDQLGLAGRDLQRWRRILNIGQGLVLVTGPTGSGKTTTLYSSLKYLAATAVNLSTIEDPIEMLIDDFNQSQINTAIDFGFAEAIRAMMRQDPDIIMVGEIRDAETAHMAIQAALTGHLVLSTLHTQDAPSAISRLIDLEVPMHLLRATLVGVVAQRLIRVLCKDCRVVVDDSNRAAADALGIDLNDRRPPLYRAVGCHKCRHTGYLGRTALYEIMPLSQSLLALVSDPLNVQAIRGIAVDEGMRMLREAGVSAAQAGNSSLDEVLRVTAEFI